MKYIFIFSCLFSGLLSNAQTPLISHKSHSGTAGNFVIDASSNFGDPPIDIQFQTPLINNTFRPLNDSVMVRQVLDVEGQITQTDTLPNKQHYSTTLFQVIYQDSIEKENARLRRIELEQEEEQFKKQQFESQKQLNEPVPVKKKKKSYLLFLLGITGGGMLLIRFFRRSKNTKPSIA